MAYSMMLEKLAIAETLSDKEAKASELRMEWAKLRHAKDPKQLEKTFVFDCWKDWQISPANYKSKAGFARDMLTKCVHLTSQKKIEDWCREWESHTSTLPAE